MAVIKQLEDLEWRMRDKTLVRLGDMTDQHLLNAAKMLRQRAAAEEDGLYSYSPRGDAASHEWELAEHALSERNILRRIWAEAMDRVRERRAHA